MPTYTELLEFLEKRADCGVEIKQKIPIKQSGSDRTRPSRQGTFVTKNQLQCSVCEDTYGIWACQMFRDKGVSDRIIIVKDASICTNCLRDSHTIEQCQSGSCRWELTLKDKEMPTYTELLEFLEKRADCGVEIKKKIPIKQSGSDRTRPSRQGTFVTKNQPQCPVCEDTHGVWACQRFRDKGVSDRITIVKNALICTNCLRDNHTIEQCQS
ncbi:unnamed protein product, partial [Heterotrigona itama]